MSNRDCANCGALCCIAWGGRVNVTDSDIEKWNEHDAQHILQYISNDKRQWLDPTTGERLKTCPFLKNNSCSIYPKEDEIDLRPNICGGYPGVKKCLNESKNEHTLDVKNEYSLNIACFIRQ